MPSITQDIEQCGKMFTFTLKGGMKGDDTTTMVVGESKEVTNDGKKGIVTLVLESKARLVTRGVPSEHGLLTLKREITPEDTLLFSIVTPHGMEWTRTFTRTPLGRHYAPTHAYPSRLFA